METAPSDRLSLRFADGIGVLVGVELAGSFLCVCLAEARRGRAHVLVYDVAHGFSLVSRFQVPSRSRSGATRLAATTDVVIASDDYTIAAFDLHTGARLWERSFEHAINLCGASEEAGHLLVADTRQGKGAFVVSLLDGTTTLEQPWLTGLAVFAVNIGPHREIGQTWGSSLRITTAEGERIESTIPNATCSVGCFDATGAHFAVGGGDGSVFVNDIGARTTKAIVKLPEPIVTVGFVGDGAVWALDRGGHLRVVALGGAVELAVDLACETNGGVLDKARTFVGVAHSETRTLHVHALPAKTEIFASKAGFQCASVALDGAGALFVAGANGVVRIDPSTCALTKAATGDLRLRALRGGGVVGGSLGSVALIPADGAKARRLGMALNGHEISTDGAKLAIVNGLLVRIYATSSGEEIDRWDLRRSWIAEAGETIDAVFFGPGDELFIVVSDTDVYARARFETGPVHRFPGPGRLVAASDGVTMNRVTARNIERVRLDDWTTTPIAATCLDVDLITATPSATGRRLALHHRDGRFAVADVEHGTVTVIEGEAGSGAELGRHELYMIDLVEAPTCAFSADERRVIVPSNGRLLFADVESGAVVGELGVSTDGKSCVVTDGRSIDWSPGKKSAKTASRPTEEICVMQSGARLEGATLDPRRHPGLLRALV